MFLPWAYSAEYAAKLAMMKSCLKKGGAAAMLIRNRLYFVGD
jgi:hypothetical protein